MEEDINGSAQIDAQSGDAENNKTKPSEGDSPTKITKWKKPFFVISGGQLFSLIGSSAVQFALIWWLATETASPLMMSLAGLAAFIPQVVLGPFAGVLVDRLKRKTVIVAADIFIGLVAALYAGAFLLFGTLPHWSVFIVLGIRGVGSVFHTPAIQAVVPLMVPKDKIVFANGISQFMQSGAFILGPAIGAVLFSFVPLWIILMSDLLGALVAAAAVIVTRIPELPPKKEHTRFFNEMKEGMKIFMRDRRLVIVTFAMLISFIFFMPLSSYYPLMSSDYFGGDAFHGASAETAFAIGMLIGSAIVGGIGVKKNKLRFVQLMMIAMGVITTACGLMPANMIGFWIFVVLCAGMGGTMNAYNIPYMAYMQETIPPEAQGRVFAFINSIMSLTMPLGLLISGPVAESMGVPFWFVITGAVTVVVTVISMFIRVKQPSSPPLTTSDIL